MLTAIIRDERSGEIVAVVPMGPKVFASGREGWHGQARAVIRGRRCILQAQAVQIVSKGEAGDEHDESVGEY